MTRFRGRGTLRTLAAASVLALAPLAVPVAATGQSAAATEAQHRPLSLEQRLERAVEALRTHQDTSGVAGLSAAIAVDGRLVWTGGFGYADLQNRVPADPQTVSRIGSISKPIAAAAAMALWDRGRIDLDAPISTALPSYPDPNGRITLRQLMSHTAGVRHYDGDEFLSNVEYTDVSAPMEVFWADPLLFEPGTDYSYSTYGWTVVSAVTVAADDERPWVEIMEQEVAGPLGLTSLQPEWQDSVIPHHASFYSRDADGAYLNAPEVDLSNKWAGGGLVATASDLVNFALGVMDGDILSDRARSEMWRKQTPDGEAPYGLGWRVGEIDGHRLVSHSGGSVGATAMLVLLPDDGTAVAVLGNTDGVSHSRIATAVARILIESP